MRRPRAKKVNYELIPRNTGALVEEAMYALLDDLVTKHHPELAMARLALAWCTSWKADADGRITLGKCRKASDLDRELADFDFVILLNRWFWKNEAVTLQQRRALLDHELCHAALKYDPRGEPVEDERGRRVYRVRKHDIEEFACIIERYGCYLRDLELFAAALRRSGHPAFVPCDECRETPGWVTTVDEHGVERTGRCACFVRWAQQGQELMAS